MRGGMQHCCLVSLHDGHKSKAIRPNSWLLFKSNVIAKLVHVVFAPRRVSTEVIITTSSRLHLTNIIAAKQPHVRTNCLVTLHVME